jgi:hypothetical protein
MACILFEMRLKCKRISGGKLRSNLQAVTSFCLYGPLFSNIVFTRQDRVTDGPELGPVFVGGPPISPSLSPGKSNVISVLGPDIRSRGIWNTLTATAGRIRSTSAG